MRILRVLRAISGSTQLDVQRRTEIPDWRLSLLESGYKSPTRRELRVLARAFEVDPELLQSTIKIQDGGLVVTLLPEIS